jgi:quinoprotein glucose dehydrogenase
MKTLVRSCGVLALAAASVVAVRSQSRQNEWRYFGGDKAFTRYSPLDQINRDNVKTLQVVWRRPAVDDKLKQAFPDLSVSSYLRSTPIMIDGMLYTQDAHGFVSAFDPAKLTVAAGPFADQEEITGQSTRGVDWQAAAISGSSSSGHSLALNAKTGKICTDFGDKGRVSLHFNENQLCGGRFSDTKLIVVINVVVVTQYRQRRRRRPEAASEDVRGFDLRPLLWTFHVVPREGEFGNDVGQRVVEGAGDLGVEPDDRRPTAWLLSTFR